MGPAMNRLKESCRTEAEKSLAAGLCQKRLIFKQNQTICGYEVDFWFCEYRLVVEVDGFIHLSEEQKRADHYKEQKLMAQGIFVIRISNKEIRENLSECLQEIETVIQRLKELKDKPMINDQWKNKLKEINVSPSAPKKKYRTVEEYFLSLDESEK
jgi:very-short-patch-repair endonuclease